MKVAKEKQKSQLKFQLGGTAKDREIVRLRDRAERLERELRTAHRKNIDDDAIRDILGTLRSAPVCTPSWTAEPVRRKAGTTPEVPMVSFADWHAGETVSRQELNGVNEYNTGIMEHRVRELVRRVIVLCRDHGPGVYPGIVVNLLGDMVSGGLHPELQKTDEEEVLPACMRVRDLLVWALQALADEFGQVYAPAVCGNHGRQTAKPEYKRYIYKSFDWLIYELVKRALADKGDDRIIVDSRPSNDVYYRVFDMRFLSMHGDMLGVKGGDGIIGAIGPIMRGEIKTRGWASSSNMPYDHLDIGHWHQDIFLPRCTVSNTLKGYCEYAKNQLRAPITEPSQALRFVHPRHGITSRWNVKVEPCAKPEKITEWVTVFDPSKVARKHNQCPETSSSTRRPQ